MKPHELRGHTIVKRLPKIALAAEIGVLNGRVSEYVLANSNARLIMVDNWQPLEKQPERYKSTNDLHAFDDRDTIEQNKKAAYSRVKRFKERAIIKPISSLEAASQVPDDSLDLVFLDADHSYEGVKEDIAAWLPNVKQGGWIGGHDYANPDKTFNFGVTEAVDDFIKVSGHKLQLDAHFTWWCRCLYG